jgi:DNA ligase (NAD+)
VTGSFAGFNPRSLAEEEIVKRSGKVVSAVSGKTTHLLAGTGAGSKLEKAVALGVKVVTEEEFVALLG